MKDAGSEVCAGSSSVVDCLATLENACTYFSATMSAAASDPPPDLRAAATDWMACAVAADVLRMASASPAARLIASCLDASDARITCCLEPSATLMDDWRAPSDSRMDARLRRSASACSSMACTMPRGGRMSLISYLMHVRPHASAAPLMEATMLALSASRSSNVLSRVILPSSDLMVVCASCDTAYSALSTPYDALCGSTTLMYSTPSMVMVTLSFVMAVCCVMDSASSLRLCTYAMASTTGSRKCRPAPSVL
mmetsp:Transcript_25694/g.65270  ORF Transcript_25694/g.65270 Transcript_25694/m.65270 type:complete len:254 (-) Transcript_25694:427-1188(-)